MDGYESIRETAERWGVSQRLVQKLCTEGRIQGAQKFSGAWAIPTDAAKPEDLRRSRHREGDRAAAVETVPRPPVQTAGKNLMPLMNTPFRPGECLLCLQRMEPGPRQEIAWAEYYYFSGQPERAIQKAGQLLYDPDIDTRLSACLLFVFANLSVGDIQRARQALSKLQDALTEPEIRRFLGETARVGRALVCLPEVDSTNLRARQLAAEGAADGTVVVADRQTAGRGRLGRSFQSPGGQGIYLTALLRPDLPPERLSPVTAMAGVAVCRAVERLCGVSPGLKWPNDPVLDGKKLCGILTELSLEGETARVQEYTLPVYHALCALIEDEFFAE